MLRHGMANEKLQAISLQIEKDRAKQKLENRRLWNQEDGATQW